MKKLFPLLAICLAFVFVSCEQEAKPEITNTIHLKTTTDNNHLRPPGGPIDPCCGEENLFERRLHWFSYLAAEVIANNQTAFSEMQVLLTNNGGNIILAEDLIGPNAQTLAFNQEFYDLLVWYYDNWTGWPNQSNTNPPFPPDTGGMPGNNQGNFLADQYYDIMLNYNCIEIYYPIGLSYLSAYPSFTSTAHPLTRSGANEGIKFYFNGIVDVYNSSEVVVNNTYVGSNENILVARPFRTTSVPSSNDPCIYIEYNEIDFHNFLDQ